MEITLEADALALEIAPLADEPTPAAADEADAAAFEAERAAPLPKIVYSPSQPISKSCSRESLTVEPTVVVKVELPDVTVETIAEVVMAEDPAAPTPKMVYLSSQLTSKSCSRVSYSGANS